MPYHRSRVFLCTRPTLMSVNAPDTKSPNLCVARFTECDYALYNYIYLGIHICVFPHMFIPRHICGAHCAVAVCTSAPCMLEDLYLDLHIPTCQCVHFTFWLSVYIACPSCLCANVMVDVRGYPRGPCAFPSARVHMFFYMHSSFSMAHSICWCEGLYLSRCAHLQLVHISMRTGVHTAHCTYCLCARIGVHIWTGVTL